jgi:hypothetical protein
MKKPNNYDSTKASGDYTPITLGGHHLIIKQVQETQSKAGRDMIIVAFDTAPGDIQPGYFTNEFANDIRPDKKWPRAGRQYILTEDTNGNCSRQFKTFINCVERSNSGFETQWGDKFAAQFKGKRIGGVFGEVESDYNGKRTMRHELRWFCADDKVESAAVPAAKYLDTGSQTVAAPARAASMDDFIQVPDGAEDEVPF